MHITIAERLRPYSHQPGVQCLIPGTSLSVQPFPTRLRFYNLLTVEPTLLEDIPLDITGPIKEFTVQEDLEKGHIIVWGHSPTGFFRYRIAKLASSDQVGIHLDKSPNSTLFPPLTSSHVSLPVTYEALWSAPPGPRLSLGNSKAQEWELVKRRFDLKEYLPLWYRAGFLTPPLTTRGKGETLELLDRCKEAIASNQAQESVEYLAQLFLVGFKGIMIPSLIDEEFQGLTTASDAQGHALSILTEGSSLIYDMFFQQKGERIQVLPVLPGKFPCGRLINIPCGNFGELDIDWTKSKLRRLIFRAHADSKVILEVPKELKKCRYRSADHDKGEWVACPIEIVAKAGQTYYFDKFQR